MTAAERLAAPGPKKLLALDGGGIRGLIAIEYLARIEELLRSHYRRPDMVLADYFDYVAGTSTGAIIGTLVSLGFDAAAIRSFYLESGPEMFAPAALHRRLSNRFAADKLSELMRRVVGVETTLGSERLRTLLMLVLRNATTSSPWPVSNNPKARYNDEALPDCNLRLPLWQLVRASTAAPVYFPPETIVVGNQTFVFVDGAVTTYNNPAFLLFLMATLAPYKVEWPAGDRQMLLISVGTGLNAGANKNLRAEQMNLLYNATTVPSALIHAAAVEQDTLCRIFGAVRHGDEIDSEVGDLVDAPSPGGGPNLFSYARYNVDLSADGLERLGLSGIDPRHVQPLDQITHLGELRAVGARAAERQVDLDHFQHFVPAGSPSDS